jgi:hypothetical protein
LQLGSGDGVISGTPTAAGSYTFSVRVTDLSTEATGDKALTCTISVRALPAVSIGGLPDPITPLQQPRITLTLASGYPAELSGQLALTFRSESTVPATDDPMIQFQSGGRTVAFTIPANSTRAVFGTSSDIGLQTGTAAGTVSITASFRLGAREVTPAPAPSRSGKINLAAPYIDRMAVQRTASGVAIAITGYSTTRQVLEATFVFTPAAGVQLQNSTFTVNTATASNTWFLSTESSQGYGGQFTYDQPFTVDKPGALQSVSVTLRNSVGTSQSKSAAF